MQPVPQDIDIYRGDFFDFFFRVRERVWDPATETYIGGAYVNLTGWTGKAQIRATKDAVAVLAEFTVTFSNQATVPGGVLFTLSGVQTAALPLTPAPPASPAVYDMQLTNAAGEPRTFVAGFARVEGDVTRA